MLSNEKKEFIKKCVSGKILDAGCGPGIYTDFLIKKGFNVTSIDLSEGMLKEAKKRVPNGRFYKMSITNLKLKAKEFDGIFCSAVFLHLDDKEVCTSLKEFSRILRKEGLLFLSTKKGKKETVKVYPDGTKKFIHFYPKKKIEDFVKKAGFFVEESYINLKDPDGDIWICIFARKR